MIEIDNLTDEYSSLFSEKALKVLKENVVPSSFAEFDNRLIPLTYLAGFVTEGQEKFLAKEIIDVFNDLCEKDMVKGVLCPLSAVSLSPTDMGQQTAVFLFAHVDDPHGYVKLTYPSLITTEGSIGVHHVY
jgi:hypothetical protein